MAQFNSNALTGDFAPDRFAALSNIFFAAISASSEEMNIEAANRDVITRYCKNMRTWTSDQSRLRRRRIKNAKFKGSCPDNLETMRAALLQLRIARDCAARPGCTAAPEQINIRDEVIEAKFERNSSSRSPLTKLLRKVGQIKCIQRTFGPSAQQLLQNSPSSARTVVDLVRVSLLGNHYSANVWITDTEYRNWLLNPDSIGYEAMCTQYPDILYCALREAITGVAEDTPGIRSVLEEHYHYKQFALNTNLSMDKVRHLLNNGFSFEEVNNELKSGLERTRRLSTITDYPFPPVIGRLLDKYYTYHSSPPANMLYVVAALPPALRNPADIARLIGLVDAPETVEQQSLARLYYNLLKSLQVYENYMVIKDGSDKEANLHWCPVCCIFYSSISDSNKDLNNIVGGTWGALMHYDMGEITMMCSKCNAPIVTTPLRGQHLTYFRNHEWRILRPCPSPDCAHLTHLDRCWQCTQRAENTAKVNKRAVFTAAQSSPQFRDEAAHGCVICRVRYPVRVTKTGMGKGEVVLQRNDGPVRVFFCNEHLPDGVVATTPKQYEEVVPAARAADQRALLEALKAGADWVTVRTAAQRGGAEVWALLVSKCKREPLIQRTYEALLAVAQKFDNQAAYAALNEICVEKNGQQTSTAEKREPSRLSMHSQLNRLRHRQ